MIKIITLLVAWWHMFTYMPSSMYYKPIIDVGNIEYKDSTLNVKFKSLGYLGEKTKHGNMINYYFVPNVVKKDSISNRYNPYSVYYQSWLGMYVINKKLEVDIKVLIDFLLNEQRNWLYSVSNVYNPQVSIVINDSININNHNGLYTVTFNMLSTVDIGSQNPKILSLFRTKRGVLKPNLIKLKCVVMICIVNGKTYIRYFSCPITLYPFIQEEYWKILNNIEI